MAILKHIRTSITAILLIATITITVTTSVQPVFAPRPCVGCELEFNDSQTDDNGNTSPNNADEAG